MYLNCKNVIYPHVAYTVWKYLEEDKGNFKKINKKLIQNDQTLDISF